MRKLLSTLILVLFGLAICAQTAYEEIRANILCSASNYMAYPEPEQPVLTPAPEGMRPFLLTHYGRHGSRYHTREQMYDAPYQTMHRADSLGKLTALGRDVMRRLDRIRQDAKGRWGELTPLGALQHRQIAARMWERFPELFADGARVEARSTTKRRCVESMQSTLAELLSHNSRLQVDSMVSECDMDYLNHQNKRLMSMRFNKECMSVFLKYIGEHDDYSHLMNSLFCDTAYVSHHVNVRDFCFELLLVAAIMQNTELRHEVTLYDVFTLDEIYNVWKIGNVRWYLGWGAAPVNGGVQPYSQCRLLRRIISDVDRCIASKDTHVQLRFGHDTVLLPLVCLLDINGFGLTTSDLDRLEDYGWINYRVFPMAANLQLVFYRRHVDDPDVRFKVLLNESEATLPLPTDSPPYYRWRDFREYALKRIADGESALSLIR